jgi:hypothetical protein
VALQDRRRGMHRAEAHLRRVEPGPLAVADLAERLQLPLLDRFFRSQHQPGRAVGDLRAVARRDAAVLLVEEGLQLGQPGHARIGAHAVVLGIDLALGVDQRHDFAVMPGLCAGDRTLMAAHRKLVHLLRVMPNFQARFSAVWPISRPTTGSVRPFMMPITGASSAAGRSLAEMRELLRRASAPASCRRTTAPSPRSRAAARATAHRRRRPAPDANARHWMLAMAESSRLHAGGAVAHHRPARHLVAAAQAQRDHAADIGFIRRRRWRSRGSPRPDRSAEKGWRTAARARPVPPGRSPRTDREHCGP